VTDAPLLPHQCAALARRLPLGVARTGTSVSHFSGDLFLGISVADAGAILASGLGAAPDAALPYSSMRYVPWAFMDPFFAAAVQATEEAIVNALVVNADMVGHRGHRSPALPVDRVLAILRGRGIV
jgi:L-aminopeptidase/D-esterase-like protein